MSLSAHRSRLAALYRDLAARWDDTKTYWRDARGQDFERQYIQNLAAQVEKTAGAIEKLDQLLSKVKRDCE